MTKCTLLALLGLALVAFAPALHANSLSALPSNTLTNVTMAVKAPAGHPTLWFPIPPIGGGGGETSVPEPTAAVSIVVLLSGFWLLRKRLFAAR